MSNFHDSTRTISAEGCAHSRQIALSPAFRARSPQMVARAARLHFTRHARSRQRVARTAGRSHSRLHFAHDLRRWLRAQRACISLDTHDLGRGLRGHPTHSCLHFAHSTRTISAEVCAQHSRLHFAHSTRTISAEGCARTGQIALSPAFARSTRTISAEGCARSRQIALLPAFRALDTHDLRRGLHFRLTLFVLPFAFKREMFFH